MKILISLTYYLPNISGVTIYADILAQHLSKKHQVTILTSQFKKNLKYKKNKNNIKIRRLWAPIRIGKGIIMPFSPIISFKKVIKNDIIICHLPQLEAIFLILWAKILNKKSIIVHHCEFGNAPGISKKIIKYLTYFPHYFAYLLADTIVAYTKDYANHSIFLSKFKNKINYILPPVILNRKNKAEIIKIKTKFNINKNTKVIGYVGRIGWEKGIDLILKSIQIIKKKYKNFKIILVGPYKQVVGDQTYKKLQKLLDKQKKHAILTGPIKHKNLANYYNIFDCLVLPSTNNLETFGIVQPEAMISGCPVVASNLPGVRVPVGKTGMGKITPIGNYKKLAENILWCLKNKTKLQKKQNKAKQIFNIKKFYNKWEQSFNND